jgi:diguanylate cyclase (GGDEF)-like protein
MINPHIHNENLQISVPVENPVRFEGPKHKDAVMDLANSALLNVELVDLAEEYQTQMVYKEDANRQMDDELTIVYDILERRAEELRSTEKEAHTDKLTNLLNKEAFEEKLAEVFNPENPNKNIAVVFIDLDGFKQVNDKLGHEYGDRALKLFGEILTRVIGQTLRKGDAFAARWAGDEFVVIVEPNAEFDVIEDDVRRNYTDEISEEKNEEQELTNRRTMLDGLKKRIINELHKELENDHLLNFGASIGIAIFQENDENETVEEFKQRYDKLMYDDKKLKKLQNKHLDYPV